MITFTISQQREIKRNPINMSDLAKRVFILIIKLQSKTDRILKNNKFVHYLTRQTNNVINSFHCITSQLSNPFSNMRLKIYKRYRHNIDIDLISY